MTFIFQDISVQTRMQKQLQMVASVYGSLPFASDIWTKELN